jgi:hypothetical protein
VVALRFRLTLLSPPVVKQMVGDAMSWAIWATGRAASPTNRTASALNSSVQCRLVLEVMLPSDFIKLLYTGVCDNWERVTGICILK